MYAIVFPGQGSQEVGMAADFRRVYDVARATFEEADDALGFALSRIIDEGPEERLRETEITQPAVLTASIAIHRVLSATLPRPPAVFAGHSLGEYTALVAAGALSFADAVRVVHQRGAFMQEAVPVGEGEMAAIVGLSGDIVREICAGTQGRVSPANFNSPEQTVIAGEVAAVRAASEALKAAGAKRAIPLDVSAPFHCELMVPAMQRLAPVLAATDFCDAKVAVISNVTAEAYTRAEDARELLGRQVCAPVQWVRCVERMVSEGVKLQLEVGPGKVLTGLAGRIDRSLQRLSVAGLDGLDAALKALAELDS